MWLHVLLGFLLFLTAIFLILLVLVQRGRGGGLAGALGGMGGQSAFGAKAGDTFTKITIWAATFWILLCMASVVLLNQHGGDKFGSQGAARESSTVDEDREKEEVESGSLRSETPATSGAGTSGAATTDETSGSATP